MNSMISSVLYHAETNGEKVALADSQGKITFAELALQAIACSDVLKQLGTGSRQCIVVECTQNIWFVVVKLACEICNCIFVPVESGISRERLLKIYQDTQAVLFVSNAHSGIEGLNAIPHIRLKKDMESRLCIGVKKLFKKPAIGFDEITEILYSTGTTGMPKGICITNKNNMAIAKNIVLGVLMPQNAVEMIMLPLSHSHGLRSIYAHLVNGSMAVIADGMSNVGLFFQLIGEYGVNAMDVSPSILKILLSIARKGLEEIAGQMEYIQIGTSVLDEDLKELLVCLFPDTRVYNFYGSTEAGRSSILNIKESAPRGCVGMSTACASFMIVDADSHSPVTANSSHPGLIAVRGEMLCAGYWKNEELTRESIKNGILYTSDMGYMDEQGRLFVLGRIDDVINYKGIKIMPEEIEMIAQKYNEVVDCICIPEPDFMCGQIPKLFVQVEDREKFNVDIFVRWLSKNLESNRMPQHVELIDKVPRAYNGKLLRKVLYKEEKEL